MTTLRATPRPLLALLALGLVAAPAPSGAALVLAPATCDVTAPGTGLALAADLLGAMGGPRHPLLGAAGPATCLGPGAPGEPGARIGALDASPPPLSLLDCARGGTCAVPTVPACAPSSGSDTSLVAQLCQGAGPAVGVADSFGSARSQGGLPPVDGICDPSGDACVLVARDNTGPECSVANEVDAAHGAAVFAVLTQGGREVIVQALWSCVDSTTYYSEQGPTIHTSLVLLYAYESLDGGPVSTSLADWFWVAVPAWDFEFCVVQLIAPAAGLDHQPDCPRQGDGSFVKPPNPPPTPV
jgi:hypothetical protein